MGRGRKDLATPNGTPLDVATSALTKTLRRADEVGALGWARELERRFPLYVWRRLIVFAAEDVGLANPGAVATVVALRTAYGDQRKESRAPKPDGNLLAMAVLLLARSDKSREADNFRQVVEYLEEEGWQPEVPPEALDLHTEAGREAIPRSERLRHWLEEASVVYPEVGTHDYRLWVRRWAMVRGVYSEAEVTELAEEWDRQGRLVYGTDGPVGGWDAYLHRHTDPDDEEDQAP